jgi:hypothetical protein
MKKITLTFLSLFFFSTIFAQTFTTGTITFAAPMSEYSVKIDVTSTLVTLTQAMPSDRWYALAFNNNGMNSGDIIAFINTANITDRQLAGFGVPVADAIQSWTTISNTVVGSTRTVVSTRAINTGEPNDYVFSASIGSINLACARSGSASFSLASHGGSANAVSTVSYPVTLATTLANTDLKINDFKIFPNPAKGFTIIELPANIETGMVKIYDALGRLVKNQVISSTENTIIIEELTTGTYLVVLRTDYGNATKSLLIE